MSNRLALETSPYLLQHRDNPVDWYPWGEEALERSVDENKPILLSIGYSACHWCHVMEKESFENEEIARLMNESFVCIKVDREERPDLDMIYQNVAQALTHGGGWPLTVFLTPARKPFFGGTYFPPEDRYGRAGFKRVLQSLAKAYQTDPMGVAQNAMKLTAYVQAAEGGKSSDGSRAPASAPEWSRLESAAELLLGHVDFENGGIGDAPKFPNCMAMSFLWRVGVLRGSASARQAVILTLRRMACGGIYDHVGGGFSRYSVDASWSVPHFEKMLYDNGLLLKLYSEVLLTPVADAPELGAEDRALFLSVVRGTTEYLLRETVSPEGGFYAAQDADSEGVEGKFFVWNPEMLGEVLRDRWELRAFSLRFGVTEAGNFEHGHTVLHLAAPLGEVARELGVSTEEAERVLESARKKVFTARERRVRPATDTKVLAAWNGLAITGLGWASRALSGAGLEFESKRALAAAEVAFELVVEKMGFGAISGKLASTFQGGQPKHNGYLDDYAFMAMAALDLARFSPLEGTLQKALRQAVLWSKRVIRHFGNAEGEAPGYFFTSDDHEELLQRPRSLFDQAIPSGSSVFLQVLGALAEIDDEVSAEFSSELERQLFALLSDAERSPFGGAELLNAAMLHLVSPVVVSGKGSSAACENPYVFRRSGGEKLLLCHRKTCDAPYADPQALKSAALAVSCIDRKSP